jgi:hypothetical protein
MSFIRPLSELSDELGAADTKPDHYRVKEMATSQLSFLKREFSVGLALLTPESRTRGLMSAYLAAVETEINRRDGAEDTAQ